MKAKDLGRMKDYPNLTLENGDINATDSVAQIAQNLIEAAHVVENSAMSLAGEVAGGQVTHLLLLSQQLERISKAISE